MRSESGVDEALRQLLTQGEPISAETVKHLVARGDAGVPATVVTIDAVDLSRYDELLAEAEVLV